MTLTNNKKILLNKEKDVPYIRFIPEIVSKEWFYVYQSYSCLSMLHFYNFIKYKRKTTKKFIEFGKNVILELKKFLKEYPHYKVAIHRAIAECYECILDFDNAEQMYLKTIKLAPHLFILNVELSKLYRCCNRWDDATKCIARVLMQYPRELNWLISDFQTILRKNIYNVLKEKRKITKQDLRKIKKLENMMRELSKCLED